MTRAGGCLCGAVRYDVVGEPRETVHCHCRMCQKSSGAAFMTWATFDAPAFSYTAAAPVLYRSSPGAVREFCGQCGSQILFRADHGRTVDVTASTFDAPDTVQPVANTWVLSRRAWLHGFDTQIADLDGEWPGDET